MICYIFSHVLGSFHFLVHLLSFNHVWHSRASLDSGFFSPTLRLHSMSIFGGAFTPRLFLEAQSLQVFAFPVIGKVIGVEK